MILTSAQNPQIKHLLALQKRRERNKSGMFLIEGYREILRAVQAGWPLDTIYFAPELFLGSNEHTLIEQSQTKAVQITEPLFQKLSYRDRPDGMLALAWQQKKELENLPSKNFYLICESIEKPGNLGSILRSSDAAGVDGVIVCDRTTDIYNPNVVRSSVGTLFTQPVIEANSIETIEWLKKQGIAIVAATPSATTNFTEADLSQPIAIAVGTEQLGLSDLWMEKADIKVRIPMQGAADSLNVAAATTLLLYEAQRQRSYAHHL